MAMKFSLSNPSSVVLLVLALAIIGAVVTGSFTEMFSGGAPEFLNQNQEKRTMEREDSSHAQRTNHFRPEPSSMGPLSGNQSEFQVNQYKAYIP